MPSVNLSIQQQVDPIPVDVTKARCVDHKQAHHLPTTLHEGGFDLMRQAVMIEHTRQLKNGCPGGGGQNHRLQVDPPSQDSQ